MIAIVFPGQGSQYLNMALDFKDNFKDAKDTFQQIEDETKINITRIISDQNQNKLNQTKYTQIAIFTSSIAIFNVIIKQFSEYSTNIKTVLGHSLGEYSALVANKVLDMNDAANLIKIRGELMQSAIKPNSSGMAAIIGKDANYVQDIINNNNLNVSIANDNSPLQVVISGLLENIDKAEPAFISSGVRRFVKLNVSAAFHSKYMQDAEVKLNNEIDKIEFNKSNIPIISNYDAKINNEPELIKLSLKKQMANKVRWTESIKMLDRMHINKIIEIGPGKVLSGLISRISKKFDIISFDKINDLDNI